jgi:hypothetical protein
MNNIQTEVKNYIIVFYDKSTLNITQKQADEIFKKSCSEAKGVKINNQYYSLNSMSKIIELKEYYRQYPEKEPQIINYFPDLPVLPKLSEIKEKEKQIKRIKAMIKGLNKYLKENNPQKNSNSRLLMIKMEEKLFKIENFNFEKNNKEQIDRFI